VAEMSDSKRSLTTLIEKGEGCENISGFVGSSDAVYRLFDSEYDPFDGK
jgi:hypothetical protein